MSNSLKERQDAFLAAILDEGAPLPEGWGNSQAAGMAVYRGNYRSALMGALAETYERTSRYLGEAQFRQVCINHAIKNPPSGWTIDEAGAGFDATCVEHFAKNPEVAELAWLEWTMLELATAPDTKAMSAQDFSAAVAEFGDEDWGSLRLALQPRCGARMVEGNLEGLWRAIDEGNEARPNPRLEEPQTCLVWREGERPTFLIVEHDHAAAFQVMQAGGTYGEMIGAVLGGNPEPTEQDVQTAAMRAGGILGKWLQEGLMIGINP